MNHALMLSSLEYVQAMKARATAQKVAEEKERAFVEALRAVDAYHGAAELWNQAKLILAVAEVQP